MTGKPILRLDVCSESEAILTCSVMESIILEWDIDFLDGNDINRLLLFHGEGQRELTRRQGLAGVVYTIDLQSHHCLR